MLGAGIGRGVLFLAVAILSLVRGDLIFSFVNSPRIMAGTVR
jgi:hypothetical protein